MRVSSQKFARRRRSQLGQSVVDYLMVTVVIAAVAIPILNSLFGDAIVGSLLSQRQRLVDFIAQTPKRPVPNIWFSAEKQANPGGGGELGGQDLKDPDDIGGQTDLDAPSDVGGKGELKEPRSIGGQKDIKVGTLATGSSAGGGGNVGGGGGGSAGGGGGGSGGSSLSGDEFFGGGGGKGGGKEGGSGDGGGGKNSFNRGGGGTNEDGSPASGGRGGGEKKEDKGGSKDGGGGEDKGGGFSGKKAEAQGVAKALEQEARRNSEFDWWFLIKFLIVCLIVFLLGLIAISNLKKR